MKIDIDKLTEDELVELNHKIVHRLRLISQMRTHKHMMNFRIGERVSFEPEGRGKIVGVVTRFNKKTVTVITDDGHHWNIPPRFLKPEVPSTSERPAAQILKLIPEA